MPFSFLSFSLFGRVKEEIGRKEKKRKLREVEGRNGKQIEIQKDKEMNGSLAFFFHFQRREIMSNLFLISLDRIFPV